MSRYLKYIVQFFLLLIFQVLILNNVTLNWWTQPAGFPVFIPFIYPLFVLLLPFETPVWLLLLIGFISGLVLDSFMNTPGMHTLALVFIAYLRTNVLLALLPKNMKEYYNEAPSVKTMGWAPFLAYSAFLVSIHHILFFTVELWSLNNIGYLLLKILASTLTTMLLIVVYLLLFSQRVANQR